MVESDFDNTSSNPEEAAWFLFSANALGKGMDPGLFNLSIATVVGEGKV